MKKSLITLGLSMLACTALAQTYTATSSRGYFVAQGVYTSASTVRAQSVDPVKATGVFLGSTASNAAVVTTELSDGTVLTSNTLSLTAGNPVSLTFPQTFKFDQVRVSPTAAPSGVNTISVTIVQ